MNQLEELCQLVLDQLSKEGYTNWGITRHWRTYHALCKYADLKSIIACIFRPLRTTCTVI
ncbi:hypothetical protein [Lacrimispora sp.]|uniref:hypothetical protein n=1 Tax=Lacrimispora sp. TaxID=2719234 RepID=UPI00345FC1DD